MHQATNARRTNSGTPSESNTAFTPGNIKKTTTSRIDLAIKTNSPRVAFGYSPNEELTVDQIKKDRAQIVKHVHPDKNKNNSTDKDYTAAINDFCDRLIEEISTIKDLSLKLPQHLKDKIDNNSFFHQAYSETQILTELKTLNAYMKDSELHDQEITLKMIKNIKQVFKNTITVNTSRPSTLDFQTAKIIYNTIKKLGLNEDTVLRGLKKTKKELLITAAAKLLCDTLRANNVGEKHTKSLLKDLLYQALPTKELNQAFHKKLRQKAFKGDIFTLRHPLASFVGFFRRH